jgi:cell division protein FtsZ
VQAAHPAGNVTPFSAGGKHSSAREQTQQAQLQMPQANAAQTAGGSHRQRRMVDQWYDEKSDLPTYVRKGQALGHLKAHHHAPGEEDFIFDEEEFEMPAFIRRQAD